MSILSAYLTQHGKTQMKFAEELGVRPATVSAWVNGKTPRPKHMKLIADHTDGAIPVTAWFEQEAGAA